MKKVLIPFNPKALDRVRITKSMRAYTKLESKQAKSTSKIYMKKQYKESPKTESVAVVMIFVHKRPKRLKNGSRVPKQTKPDIDNLAKLYFDAANGILWKDDNQITSLCCFDYYASSDEDPHVEIYFQEISEQEQKDLIKNILNYFIVSDVDNKFI